MRRYRLNNIKLPLEADDGEVVAAVRARFGAGVRNCRIVRKSLDARHKDCLWKIYAAAFEYDGELAADSDLLELPAEEERLDFAAASYGAGRGKAMRPVIVGAGPAGMMAALCLAEAGAKPIVLERGAPVGERQEAVRRFWETGELNEGTNVQFGEGGAGTFSDGKLMTGIKKDKFTAKVLETFVATGAPEEILYLAKPHIGTDKLAAMVGNIRRRITTLGGEYRFYETLVDLELEEKAGAEDVRRLAAAVVQRADGTRYEIAADTLVLALGHSARDTFKMLFEHGLDMAQKPFAVGVRIEHKQEDINLAQYGKKYGRSPYLGAADYKLAVHLAGGRSVYTFCMCPGGTVVAATSLAGHVVTNGMSEYARDKENANAAVLVNVDGRDFGSAHPLAGMEFQERLEKTAFALGGGNYFAPAQTVGDFLNGRKTEKFGRVRPSYKPGVAPADFRQLFDKPLYEALQEGIRQMDKKLHGFAAADAVLTAVESRSSSPVRLIRGADFMSNIGGVYPIGEGAGYAGGITSAAADGVRLAAALCGIK